ncbi:predicted protein [Sclerotinia sclerotiorum 1980 UF-70]|uniref:Uncharacterized protein n=2 Tax=Sclerotinia sclerotiorum (strain ATCC 18683 / 1980 / Ss-1) TaxID=665079 RepID=A7F2F1_SCLS1|nr:predicted protein [Sclerotinia sclerotiorum 1980 UF-70]APA09311.1 hypothetical protein sscle_05g040810 [Sclerotinia sclerotiorum 1980 UF-70]EDN95893.1 predicted protein [Sclerotinia sclerotiorum 1980 UF-70]
MPSLEDIYRARGMRQSDSGLYTITNTPWIAQNTQEKAITFSSTSAKIEAFSIFASWNIHGELKHAEQFAGVTSEDVYQRLDQYNILWNQLLECYRLSQLLIAPKFANKIIDTMIEAIREECSWQTRRRKLEDEDEQFAIESLGSEEYQALMKRLDEVSLVTGDNVFNQTQNGAETLNQLPRAIIHPDSRHVLGATPLQITKLYADTNPGALLRRMIVDMIISYSIRFPKYYGKNDGFGELLGGSDPSTEGKFCVPIDFVQNLLTAYAKAKGGKNDRWMDENSCKYHDHKYGGTAACIRARERANDNATSIAEAAVNALEDTGEIDVVTANV